MTKKSSGGDDRLRSGDIRTVGYFADRARDRLDFDLGANDVVDPAEVPRDLQHLIPFVRRWAIPGSGPQMVFIEHLQENAPQDVEAFCEAVAPCFDDILNWIRTEVDKGGKSPRAVSSFSYLISAYELAKPPDPLVLEKSMTAAEEFQRRKQQKQDIREAVEAMRIRDFAEVVRLLEPYAEELGGADWKRLEIARKRV
jgi:hypothetical protein